MLTEVRELQMEGRSLSDRGTVEPDVNIEWKYVLNRVPMSLSQCANVLSKYTEEGMSDDQVM